LHLRQATMFEAHTEQGPDKTGKDNYSDERQKESGPQGQLGRQNIKATSQGRVVKIPWRPERFHHASCNGERKQ
jgi:hypothetical protein